METMYDVLIVGAGNAALCAAIAAAEHGASTLVLEKAPEYFRGGNTYFTGGIIRCAYNGMEDIKALIPDMTPEEEATTDVGTYDEDQFYSDVMRVTEGLADPELNASLCGYEVDFLWRPQRRVIEVDGHTYHSTRQSATRDRRRDDDLAAAGYRVTRFTAEQILYDARDTLARTRRALGAQ